MYKNAILFTTVVLALAILAAAPPLHAAIQEQVLHSFGEDANGGYPISSIVADSQGNLYGTTFEGGDGFAGTVFELTR
ncbi:MAG: hypothetical protein LAO09_11755 [Acidobacteriia bacterium]|nr:hypothetical protein [Terriglobia bacterium]